jgi:hypothetical protein
MTIKNKKNLIYVCLLILINNFTTCLSTNAITDEICTPLCKSTGVCFQSKCYCTDGYLGDDCSIEIHTKGFRVGIILMIIFFLVSILIGGISSYIIFKCCSYCCVSSSKIPNFKDDTLDLMETWEKRNN